ncbi:MAG: hypothetical protein ACM3KM_00540 [Acidobacteriaceae bacterium]
MTPLKLTSRVTVVVNGLARDLCLLPPDFFATISFIAPNPRRCLLKCSICGNPAIFRISIHTQSTPDFTRDHDACEQHFIEVASKAADEISVIERLLGLFYPAGPKLVLPEVRSLRQ